ACTRRSSSRTPGKSAGCCTRRVTCSASKRREAMKLNTIGPAAGSKKPRLRVGRGASAGQGKTCGRGVKGQRARKGGYHKVGFEGGQMPLQRRLPKTGFRSAIARTVAEVRLSELAKVKGDAINLDSLKEANVVPATVLRARIV